ncbi:MAG: hypothetical protein RR983_20575 [Massilia sp.]
MLAVLARDGAGEFIEAIQFDRHRVVAETAQHILAQQQHGGSCHRQHGKEHGGKEAVADGDFHGRARKW